MGHKSFHEVGERKTKLGIDKMRAAHPGEDLDTSDSVLRTEWNELWSEHSFHKRRAEEWNAEVERIDRQLVRYKWPTIAIAVAAWIVTNAVTWAIGRYG